ncbi:MAG: 2-oxoglutarate dehydrogenase, E2 component, dihydrolipoamide succinyltransferase [Calditrichia bacterium]
MIIDVKMPKLGESLTEGTVLKWWKKVGDSVQKDELLLEVSTDKVDSEIPSPVSGTLVEIVAQENETVEVDAVLARIETVGQPSASPEKSKMKPEKEIKPSREKAAEPAGMASPARLIEVRMPKLGESLTEGTILKWWKQIGDPVEKDETLLEVSTDKVDSEIPSPIKGILREILVQENETVVVDTLLARMESLSDVPIEKEKIEKRAPVAEAPEMRPPADKKEKTIPRRKAGRFYSPLVLNIARKESIPMEELERIKGSGKNGRVTKKDILQYVSSRHVRPAVKETAAPPALQEFVPAGEREIVIPMDAVRKRIAVHMRQSVDTAAHVYSVSECDMTRVLNLIREKRPAFQREEGFKLTVTPFILQAVTRAILEFPRINSSLVGENIIEKRYVNLGIAVAAQKGLLVPVIKNAEEKNFRGLARAFYDIVTRTRENRLTVDDVQGATFTVTNYGIFGNIIGLPIINQPNVAILGVGAIKKRPVVIESPEGDSLAIRSIAYISMSYDHRVVDGELGGKFMQRLVEHLEQVDESWL